MTVKHPWETELDQDDNDPVIQAIITIAYVTALTLSCTFVLFLTLGLLWPHIEGWL